MEKPSEVFVAFDAAKRKHAVAVAVAEAGRTGEVSIGIELCRPIGVQD